MVLVMFASTNTDDPAIALWVNTVWLYASSKNQPLLVLAGRVISCPSFRLSFGCLLCRHLSFRRFTCWNDKPIFRNVSHNVLIPDSNIFVGGMRHPFLEGRMTC
jgi:hypothetical protein